jgi:hypothetical protein
MVADSFCRQHDGPYTLSYLQSRNDSLKSEHAGDAAVHVFLVFLHGGNIIL